MTTAATPMGKRDFESQTVKPVAVPVNPDGIPAELKVLDQWVAWKYSWDPEKAKWDKPPLNPRTGRNGMSNDPETWTSFDFALRAYQAGGFDGIGFVITEKDPYCGIDLDDSRDRETGAVSEWAKAGTLQTYAEQSPSGTGIKAICKAKLPSGGRKFKTSDYRFELTDGGLYFTITGERLPWAPTTIEERQKEIDELHARLSAEKEPKAKQAGPKPSTNGYHTLSDAELIAKARAAKNGDKFDRLWRGEFSGYPSRSEADAALCGILAFYAQGDASHIDSLFRQSGLMRDKWDEKRPGGTYGSDTIAFALDGKTEFYKPGRKKEQSGAEHKLGNLTLAPGEPRRTTGSKLIVPVTIRKDGVSIDEVVLTSSATGRRAAVRQIGIHLEEEDAIAIEMITGKIFADAVATLNQPKVALEGQTVLQVAARVVIEDFGPASKTSDGGIYCEKLGCEKKRQDVIHYLPSHLVTQARQAVNAPTSDAALYKAIEAALKTVWSDLQRSLPSMANANLGHQSMAAKDFRSAMLSLFTMTNTWEATGEGSARRASLISRAYEQIQQQQIIIEREGKYKYRPLWARILPGASAWWRIGILPDGELRPFLALHFTLMHQIRMPLPGVSDQKSLVTIGKKFGILDPDPPVPTRGEHGTTRLAVLAPSITDALLDIASDYFGNEKTDDDENHRHPNPNDDGPDRHPKQELSENEPMTQNQSNDDENASFDENSVELPSIG